MLFPSFHGDIIAEVLRGICLGVVFLSNRTLLPWLGRLRVQAIATLVWFLELADAHLLGTEYIKPSNSAYIYPLKSQFPSIMIRYSKDPLWVQFLTSLKSHSCWLIY